MTTPDELRRRWETLRGHRREPDVEEVPDTVGRRWSVNVPRAFADAVWYGDQVADQRVSDWIITPCQNLVLLGDTGVGKSRLAWLACIELAKLGDRVMGGQCAEVLDGWREDRDVFWEWCEADVVLLDDVGAEKRSDWTAERLDLLIDYRWREGARSIITSNLAPAQLAEHLGERSYSRLRDDVCAIHVKGEDHRGN